MISLVTFTLYPGDYMRLVHIAFMELAGYFV